jgi:phosphoribosylglycinamide formyltransferase-1
MKIFLITEVCYHAAYLINMLGKTSDQLAQKNHILQIIVRDKNNLNREKLTEIHNQLKAKKELTTDEISALGNAYGGELSQAELALIKMYGVPRSHALSISPIYSTNDLNSVKTLDWLDAQSRQEQLSAIIFLDCILKPRWLEIFENRIVNAHSAILPRARGMYAIEQMAALSDPEKFTNAAGASIHYIDEKVDVGLLIKVKPLVNIWDFTDIWQIKAASYMAAFELMTAYLNQENPFKLNDGAAYSEEMGPVFKAKEFNDAVKSKAINSFNYMKLNKKLSLVGTKVNMFFSSAKLSEDSVINKTSPNPMIGQLTM